MALGNGDLLQDDCCNMIHMYHNGRNFLVLPPDKFHTCHSEIVSCWDHHQTYYISNKPIFQRRHRILNNVCLQVVLYHKERTQLLWLGFFEARAFSWDPAKEETSEWEFEGQTHSVNDMHCGYKYFTGIYHTIREKPQSSIFPIRFCGVHKLKAIPLRSFASAW